MKKKIGVITDDDYLYQKIYLALLDDPALCALRGADGADVILCDAGADVPSGLPTYTMSRAVGADLRIPFTEEALLSLFSGCASSAALTLGNRAAFLHEKEIKLTEVEFSLLSLLYNRRDFVSREELIRSVWGVGADGGVLNVYIHYLREKLEFAGEKIILSSRKQGYRIDEKYLAEGEKDA